MDIPELYHLAASLDLGLKRPLTQADVQAWVVQLMRRRVQELHDQLGQVLEPPGVQVGRFTFSFEPTAEDIAEEDELLGLADEDMEDTLP